MILSSFQKHPSLIDAVRNAFEKVQDYDGTQSAVYLCLNSIFGRTNEGLDLEVLLDLFEEQLDQPTTLVDISYCRGSKTQIVADQH